jgi:hypothetical protein
MASGAFQRDSIASGGRGFSEEQISIRGFAEEPISIMGLSEEKIIIRGFSEGQHSIKRLLRWTAKHQRIFRDTA